MKVLLEHKKRKKDSGLDHPKYHINLENRGQGQVHYHAYSKADGSHIATLRGTNKKRNRQFNVELVHAKSMLMRSKEAEDSRLAGVRHVPHDLISHVLKHVRKTFPGSLRMTASRESGANPMHHVDVPLRRPSNHEVAMKKKRAGGTITGKSYKDYRHDDLNFHMAKIPGHSLPTSITHTGRTFKTVGDLGGWRGVRKLAKLAKSAGVKKLSFEPRDREILLNKPKKGNPYIVKHREVGSSSTIHHPRAGRLMDLDSKIHTPGIATVEPHIHTGSKKTRFALKNMTFGQKRRLYRVFKDKIAPSQGAHTVARDKAYPSGIYTKKFIKSKQLFHPKN